MPGYLTPTQQKVLAIAPKPSAVISIFASLYIIFRVVQDKENRKKMYHRIMVALSIHSILQSAWFFWGTWAIPEGLIYGASGTVSTCTAQGFLLQFSLTIPLYYAMLSVFAFLSMRSTPTNKFIHRIEPWMHISVHVFPLASSIVLQQKEMLNPNGPWCWIESFPPGCDTSDKFSCIRGGSLSSGRAMWIFAGIPFFFLLLLATVMMGMLYFTVRRRERAIGNLLGKTKFMEQARHRRSRIVAKQALLYLLIFYIYTFSATTRLIQLSTGTLHFPTIVVMIILLPLQGFFNFIVYTSSERWSITEYKTSTELPKSSIQIMMNTPSICKQPKQEIRKFSFNIFDGTNPSDTWKEFIVNNEEDDDCEPERITRLNSNETDQKSSFGEDQV